MLVAWNITVFLLWSVLPFFFPFWVWPDRMWMNIRWDTGCVRALSSASVFIHMENTPGAPSNLQYTERKEWMYSYIVKTEDGFCWVRSCIIYQKGVLSFVVYSFNVLRIRICRKTWARIENRMSVKSYFVFMKYSYGIHKLFVFLSIAAMVATERMTRWAAKAGGS